MEVNYETRTQIDSKVITCLDGKERIFRFISDGSITYSALKNNKVFGSSYYIKRTKLPKWITKEMLGI